MKVTLALVSGLAAANAFSFSDITSSVKTIVARKGGSSSPSSGSNVSGGSGGSGKGGNGGGNNAAVTTTTTTANNGGNNGGNTAANTAGTTTTTTTSGGNNGKCPAVWTTISSDLTGSFLSGGQCTDLARAAIRYSFHDAGTFSNRLPTFAPASGGADGSLMLIPSEINRPENNGLQSYHAFITAMHNKYQSQGVGAADLIQFAAAHAIVTCPGGPTVTAVVGRKDATRASPTGVMPAGFGAGSDHDTLLNLFLDKGFSALDLAALVGAHSTSKNVAETAIPIGAPQDSTPGAWDTVFYSQTYNPPAGVARFQSDINLSNPNTAVGKEFLGFAKAGQGKWNGKFADAMRRLSVLGISSADQASFIDCTAALPRGSSSKRDIRARPINDRVL